MRFNLYIKDKIIYIIVFLIVTILKTLMLKAFKLNNSVIIVFFYVDLILGLILLLGNYYNKNKFYNKFLGNMKVLDKKYLILETLNKPTTNEEKLFTNILYEINRSYIESINKNVNNINDFKEYVELWIHEVKIPISSLVLKCHNNKNKYTKDFIEQIRRLDDYVDQVLYYVRSEYAEKDFIISECNLNDIVKNVILKNKDDLLDNKIELIVNNMDNIINTDSKWLEFIINQIINNSIKYKCNNNSKIAISSEKTDDKVILTIEDNGIGILKKDIKNIFNKSFTGTNGRNKVKSTGMGLYIVKKLCDKLGHTVTCSSEENKYTKINLIFYLNDYFNVTKS